MRCITIRLSDGTTAIVCGRGSWRLARCYVCGEPASYQCDHPTPRKSGLCDRYLCAAHRVKQKTRGVDFCPEHARQMQLSGV
jgi:hypothetical protein